VTLLALLLTFQRGWKLLALFLLQEWPGILHSKALELDRDRKPQLA